MIQVQGKNVNMKVYKDGNYILTICSTNISRRQSTSTLTTLVRGAGKSRRFKPTVNEETITLDGLRTIDEDTLFQIHNFIIGEFYTVRITYDDLAGNTIQLDGNILVTGIDDNNGAGDFSTWSVTMVKNGAWSQSGTGTADVIPPVVIRARATGEHTVRVTFNEGVVPTTVGWTVYISDLVTTTGITAVSGSGNVWDFTTGDIMSPGQTLFLNYSTTGNTLDLAGNEMDTLLNFPIENIVIAVSTFVGQLGHFTVDPYATLSGGTDILSWPISVTFSHNGPMSFNISSVPAGRWVVVKVPDTEPLKLNWYNTAFNNGTIPDSVFWDEVLNAGFRYYITRNPTFFDTTQTLNIS